MATSIPLIASGRQKTAGWRGGLRNDGLQIDFRMQPCGIIELDALPDHLLKIHAGGPVRGICSQGRRFLYRHGDLDLFPAGSTASWSIDDNSSALLVRVPTRLLRQAAQALDLNPDEARLHPRHQFRSPSLEHIVWALGAESRAGFPNGMLYTDNLGAALAIQLLRHPGTAVVSQPRGLPPRDIQRVLDYIEAHLHGKLRLEHLAALTSYCTSHFGVLFKRATGSSVHEYVIRRRVERAQALMSRDDLSLSQIALEAGFAHQSHMARWMRRFSGLTPTAARARGTRSRRGS